MTVENKISDIANFLINVNQNEVESGDLFIGSAGISLFLYHYSRQKNSLAAEQKASLFLDHSIQKIDESVQQSILNYTFCQGLGGVCWTIDHLAQYGFIDEDSRAILSHFDQFLAETSLKASEAGNYDFLHGAIGTSIYLLKRSQVKTVNAVLNQIIELLETKKQSIGTEEFYWNHKIGLLANGTACNLSLSHGISSILIFLAKAYSLGIKPEVTEKLLKGGLNFLLQQENQNHDRLSMFPNYSFVTDGDSNLVSRSRIGWCYGDLGIGLALWHCSKALSEETLAKKAIEIFVNASKRRNLIENVVVDAGICHGTGGIAMIFHRMHRVTGRKEFSNARDYWIDQTLSMASYPDGYCGYKADQHLPALGMLEGISGIGLAILSASNESDTHWADCLLLP